VSDDAGWSIEVRIPLGRQPRDRPIFSWTSMGGGGHNPERFGLFLFE